MRSLISFEEYEAWCKSRFPASDPCSAPESFTRTIPATGDEEECPVTVRSSRDAVVVTPRPRGSY